MGCGGCGGRGKPVRVARDTKKGKLNTITNGVIVIRHRPKKPRRPRAPKGNGIRVARSGRRKK